MAVWEDVARTMTHVFPDDEEPHRHPLQALKSAKIARPQTCHPCLALIAFFGECFAIGWLVCWLAGFLLYRGTTDILPNLMMQR